MRPPRSLVAPQRREILNGLLQIDFQHAQRHLSR